jgi:phosphohistidine phosphatase
MQVYFIRHAIAMSHMPSVETPDGERALTEVGIKKMRRQARALRAMGVEFDVILTSPLLRAVQTAEIVAKALKCPDRIKRCGALVPGCQISALIGVLGEYDSDKSVALVGHNPDFEELVADLLGVAGDGGIVFKKGAVCRIDVTRLEPEPVGELVWHLTPKLLRMIGA